jgi:hypothetical protein
MDFSALSQHRIYSSCESDLRFADLGSPYAELTGENEKKKKKNAKK